MIEVSREFNEMHQVFVVGRVAEGDVEEVVFYHVEDLDKNILRFGSDAMEFGFQTKPSFNEKGIAVMERDQVVITLPSDTNAVGNLFAFKTLVDKMVADGLIPTEALTVQELK